MRFCLLASVFLAMVAGCSNSSDKSATGEQTSLDDVLRVNDIQLKATHNSYHVETDGNTIPDWHFTRDPLPVQLETQGVRGLELDTHYDTTTGTVAVYHVPTLDEQTTCRLFTDCLSAIKTWSDDHLGHHVVFVQIEPKDEEFGAMPDWALYAEELDREILSVWPRDRVLTPDDVQNGAATLRDAVTSRGWPTLGQTRGKIAFYIDDRGLFHDTYSRGATDVSGRMMFPSSLADEPIAAMLVMNDPIMDDIDGVVSQGFIVRTMADSVPAPMDLVERRQAALASGAQIVTTDYPVSDGTTDALVIPDGTPSRCNPVAAPAQCTSEVIERL
jgi:hypothetical protein